MSYERVMVVLVLIGYLIIATIFSSQSPLLEGPNEVEHYRFIREVARTGQLPDRAGYPYGQLHQAPLYYVVGAPILMAIDDPLYDDIGQRLNPFYPHEFAVPSSDNKNVHLHLASDADTGVARAVGWLRLYSIMLGLLTVIIGYAIMRLVFPEQVHLRLLGLAIVAFSPQFVYMTTTINNDNMLFFGAALSFYFALHQAIHGPTYRKAILLGIALGIALLGKSSAGMLVFPMAVAVLLDRRTWFWYAPVTLGVTILVAGWWYLQNFMWYGDPTGIQAMFQTWPTEMIVPGGGADWALGFERAWYGYESFWGRYGHGAVALGEEIYTFFDGVVLLSVAGLIIWAGRQIWQKRKPNSDDYRRIRLAVIIAAFTLVWIAALIYSSSTVYTGNQGRYLMPGFAGWGILIAVGLNQWLPRRIKIAGASVFVVMMAGVLLYSQVRYFIPAYQTQPPPPDATPIYTYEDIVQLIDVVPTRLYAEPGDIVRVQLAWRVLQPTSRDLLTYVHTADAGIVRRDSYPGTGHFLTADWQANDAWSETFVIRVPDDAERQRVYPLIAGYYDPSLDQALAAQNPDGQTVTPFIGELVINGEPSTIDAAYTLGDTISMTRPAVTTLDDGLQVCLTWHATQSPIHTYHAFLHVLDEANTIITQADFAPKANYPTSAWRAGDVVTHCQTFTDANGATQIATGLYDLNTLTRLPVRDAAGHAQPNDMITLALTSDAS